MQLGLLILFTVYHHIEKIELSLTAGKRRVWDVTAEIKMYVIYPKPSRCKYL